MRLCSHLVTNDRAADENVTSFINQCVLMSQATFNASQQTPNLYVDVNQIDNEYSIALNITKPSQNFDIKNH